MELLKEHIEKRLLGLLNTLAIHEVAKLLRGIRFDCTFISLVFLKKSLSSVFSNKWTVPGPQAQAKPLEYDTIAVTCGVIDNDPPSSSFLKDNKKH